MALTDKIIKIADKTRELTGLPNKMTLDEIASNMDLIKIKPNLQNKTIEITENNTQTITADEGYDGLNSVEVTTNIESSNIVKMYLIKNGIEQTDITGGNTFEQKAGLEPNGVGMAQGTDSLNLYTGLWARCDITFNNEFDLSKYSKLYIDYAFQNSNVTSSMQQYMNASIVFVNSDISTHLFDGNTVERTTLEIPIIDNLESDQISINCSNLSGDNGVDSSNYNSNYPLMIYNLWLEGGVEQDYITDGLIAWFDGEDEMDSNIHWNSRVGSDYIYRSGTGLSTEEITNNDINCMKSSNSYLNNRMYSMSTSEDYYKEGYTVEVIGKTNNGSNSTDYAYTDANLTGSVLFGIGRTKSVFVSVAKHAGVLRVLNEPNDIALPEPHTGLHGKTFSCALNFEQIIPRGNTSGTEIFNYAFNGGKYNNYTLALTGPFKNDGTCNVLCYYKDSYRSSGEINCIRVYNRKLTEDELQHNFTIDKARFNIEE